MQKWRFQLKLWFTFFSFFFFFGKSYFMSLGVKWCASSTESNCLRLLQVSSGVCGSLSLCKPWAHQPTEHTSSRPWYLTLHLTRWHSSSNLEKKKRPESAYQSLNHCLTALQQKTHLIQEMADKPSEILRPWAEHLKSSSAIRGFLCIDTAMSIASFSHYWSNSVSCRCGIRQIDRIENNSLCIWLFGSTVVCNDRFHCSFFFNRKKIN